MDHCRPVPGSLPDATDASQSIALHPAKLPCLSGVRTSLCSADTLRPETPEAQTDVQRTGNRTLICRWIPLVAFFPSSLLPSPSPSSASISFSVSEPRALHGLRHARTRTRRNALVARQNVSGTLVARGLKVQHQIWLTTEPGRKTKESRQSRNGGQFVVVTTLN